MFRTGKAPKLLAVAVPLVALGAWLAGWGPSALAGTSRRDVAATRSYLRTEVAFFRTVVVNSHLGARAGDELVGHVAKECRGVASGAPRGEAAEEAEDKMREEALDALVLVVVSPDLAAERQAAVTLGRLHWSSRKLTVLVHRRARIEAATSALALPDLCGDLKEWAASGRVTSPAADAHPLAGGVRGARCRWPETSQEQGDP